MHFFTAVLPFAWVSFVLAAGTYPAVVLEASGQSILYQIDSTTRGAEILSTFSSLSHASGTQVPEFALQTSLPNNIPYKTYSYISNGIIPYVQSITPTVYNTLLIVTYLTPQTYGVAQYLVLPPEQVIAVLYFPTLWNLPKVPGGFTAAAPAGTTPYFSVNPYERAIDIASAVNQLMQAPFHTSNTNQVWMQTTLTGPFNPPIPNGLLQNITSISAASGLLQISFLPPYQQTQQFVILAPEQMQRIIYVLNFNAP